LFLFVLTKPAAWAVSPRDMGDHDLVDEGCKEKDSPKARQNSKILAANGHCILENAL